MKLSEKRCVPCEGGINPLKQNEIKRFLEKIEDWEPINNHHIVKKYKFDDFKSALAFVNKISKISEEQGHHPHICFTWGKVTVKIWTHAIDGLHENDFILASKFDEVNQK